VKALYLAAEPLPKQILVNPLTSRKLPRYIPEKDFGTWTRYGWVRRASPPARSRTDPLEEPVHTPKPRSVFVIATLAAALLTGGAGRGAVASGTPTGTLTVDLSATTGAFHGGASGALYGLYDQDVPSDNQIRGMGLRTTDTKAQDGQQHPGSDALEIAKPFFASGGRDVLIYLTDVYRNFPYERTSYAQYQGYLKTEMEQVLSSPYRDHIVLVPYNEPDANWFGGMVGNQATLDAFDAEWLQTFRYLKGLWPRGRIAGPNLTGYYPGTFATFLTFCKANGCLPDVMTWHELSVPSHVRPDVATYRTLEKQVGLGSPLPVNLNEYAARYQLTNPGQMVPWLSALEDTKVDGDLAYWNINGSLGDSVAQQNVPNAQWWLYRWYAAMTGQTVQVTPPQGDADNTMQGLATVDTGKRQARVILGGGPPGQSAVTVKNISRAVFGRTVHATVEQDRWSGTVGAAAQPARMLDMDLPVGADGTVTLPIDNGTPPAATGCAATGSRVTGRLGNAVALCGNGEYVTLPSGVASNLTDFTISAWVNPAQNSTWSRLFDFGNGPATNMFLTLNSGNQLRFAITAGGAGGEQQINGTGTLPLNTWSHVAVTLSGTTGTLYVNGQVVGTNSNMTLHPSNLGVTSQNWIGRSQYSDPYLDGAVDDFQIYSRALSASDMATLAGGRPGAGDVASYRFDEASGATAEDSSGNGHTATIVSAPQLPPAMNAYQIILSPGGTGSATPANGTWTHSYEAEDATLTGAGWNINTEGTAGNLFGLATSNNKDVGGLRTGSSTVITFHVDVPRTADYNLSIFESSFAHNWNVTGPTNIFARVDGGPPQQVYLPVVYEWPIWDRADTTVHLTAGTHDISLSTMGLGASATNGDAIIDKIDLQLKNPAVQNPTVYEAEQADLHGAGTDYRRQGQSGAGAVDLDRGQNATFWVYSATDGYTDLSLRTRATGIARTSVNDQDVIVLPSGTDRSGWLTQAARVYLRSGVNKVTVTGQLGRVVLDKLTATPVTATQPAVTTYQAEAGALTGTAKVDNSYSQADGGVVTGIGNGPANALTLTVHAPLPGRYAMTVRFANDTELDATHYNPDLMTAPADISVNGGPTRHVNFANTFSWNQFWTLTIPVTLKKGTNTITFIANQQYNYDGTTVGVIYSGSNGVGSPLRSSTAPNLDSITLAPLQVPADPGR
jgi:hypothetical protein